MTPREAIDNARDLIGPMGAGGHADTERACAVLRAALALAEAVDDARGTVPLSLCDALAAYRAALDGTAR